MALGKGILMIVPIETIINLVALPFIVLMLVTIVVIGIYALIPPMKGRS